MIEFLMWTIDRVAEIGGRVGMFFLYLFAAAIMYYLYRLVRYVMFMMGVLVHGWPEYEDDEDVEEDAVDEDD